MKKICQNCGGHTFTSNGKLCASPNCYEYYAKIRFEAFVTKSDSSDCWLWTATVTSSGYGRFAFRDKLERAHRAAWKLYKGPIPTGLNVLHRCDVRLCVNPDHLFLGSQKENIWDMILKGRDNFKGTLLSDTQVATIRDKWSERTATGVALARHYGVTPSCISAIVTGIRRKPHLISDVEATTGGEATSTS